METSVSESTKDQLGCGLPGMGGGRRGAAFWALFLLSGTVHSTRFYGNAGGDSLPVGLTKFSVGRCL